MRFIADAMLGSLARWMRVLGYDTLYAHDIPDEDIIRLAQMDSRVIISRDRELCAKMPGSILIEDIDLEIQLAKVISFQTPDSAALLTRCLECNTSLEHISKSQVGAGCRPLSWSRTMNSGFVRIATVFTVQMPRTLSPLGLR